LTGSTGNLGAEILSRLLSTKDVGQVYAYNRPSEDSTSQDRHKKRFEDKGLELKLLEDERLVFLEGNLTAEALDLPSNVYNEVCRTLPSAELYH
jgi:thioester reductase-like protein